MLLLWRQAGQLPACLGPAQLPLRKHRLSKLFAAWQSCQGCTHSSKLSRKLLPEMPRTYQVPRSPNLDHFPPCPARPPRRAGTAGQPLHCGGGPATWRPSCQSCHGWHSWPAWSPRAAPLWLPTHFTGGKRLNSAGPGSGSGGLAPSCHPPPEPPTLTGLAPSCHLPPELPASSASPRPCGSRHIFLAENA